MPGKEVSGEEKRPQTKPERIVGFEFGRCFIPLQNSFASSKTPQRRTRSGSVEEFVCDLLVSSSSKVSQEEKVVLEYLERRVWDKAE
jgi:hypothetical protein